MRYGVIISFNKEAKIGVIKDLNQQKIRFHIESPTVNFNRTDLVSYEIALMETGLAAVNITLVVAKFSEVFKFKPLSKLKD